MRVGFGRQNIIICFGNNEAEQFHFWEYINGNQTFILVFYWPFVCSAEACGKSTICTVKVCYI
jgi:hypothetical protein